MDPGSPHAPHTDANKQCKELWERLQRHIEQQLQDIENVEQGVSVQRGTLDSERQALETQRQGIEAQRQSVEAEAQRLTALETELKAREAALSASESELGRRQVLQASELARQRTSLLELQQTVLKQFFDMQARVGEAKGLFALLQSTIKSPSNPLPAGPGPFFPPPGMAGWPPPAHPTASAPQAASPPFPLSFPHWNHGLGPLDTQGPPPDSDMPPPPSRPPPDAADAQSPGGDSRRGSGASGEQAPPRDTGSGPSGNQVAHPPQPATAEVTGGSVLAGGSGPPTAQRSPSVSGGQPPADPAGGVTSDPLSPMQEGTRATSAPRPAMATVIAGGGDGALSDVEVYGGGGPSSGGGAMHRAKSPPRPAMATVTAGDTTSDERPARAARGRVRGGPPQRADSVGERATAHGVGSTAVHAERAETDPRLDAAAQHGLGGQPEGGEGELGHQDGGAAAGQAEDGEPGQASRDAQAVSTVMQSSQDQEVSQKEAEEEVTNKPLVRQRESPQLAVVQAPRSFGRVHSTESGTPRSGSLAQSAPPVESRPHTAKAPTQDAAHASPPLNAAQLFQASPAANAGPPPGGPAMVAFGQAPTRGLQFPHHQAFGAGLLQGINPAHLPFSSFSPLGGPSPLLDQGLPMFGAMGGRVPHSLPLAVETVASSAASVGNAVKTAATASGGAATASRHTHAREEDVSGLHRRDAGAQQHHSGRKRESEGGDGKHSGGSNGAAWGGKRGRLVGREEGPRRGGRGRARPARSGGGALSNGGRGKPPRHRPSPGPPAVPSDAEDGCDSDAEGELQGAVRALQQQVQGNTNGTVPAEPLSATHQPLEAATPLHIPTDAATALAVDAPELLAMLQAPEASVGEAVGGVPVLALGGWGPAANHLQAVLQRLGDTSQSPATRGAEGRPNPGALGGGEGSGYTLTGLQCLLEAANAMGQGVRWGWCREVKAFVFVFEPAHRIVVEWCVYGTAAYVFEMEEPLPVDVQLRRLVWVLSAPGAHRGALLLAPDAEVDARITASLGEEERRVLSEFGWQAGCGVRTMLNFQGERLIHDYKEAGRQRMRARVKAVLAAGTRGGRPYKDPPPALCNGM